MTAFARAARAAGMIALVAVEAVGWALHGEMRFDPEATDVDTPAAKAFAAHHGLCQAFTHVIISSRRGIDIPAPTTSASPSAAITTMSRRYAGRCGGGRAREPPRRRRRQRSALGADFEQFPPVTPGQAAVRRRGVRPA